MVLVQANILVSAVYAVELGTRGTTCPQRGDLLCKERKEAKCSNCGVGGHKKNTCNKPKVVLHVVENATLEQIFI